MHSQLPGCQKPNLRPALLGEIQVDSGRGQIDELSIPVLRQILIGLVPKPREQGFVPAIDPPGGPDRYRLHDCLHTILVLESIGGHVELEYPHGPQDHVVVPERPEHLGGTLLAELEHPLVQGLHAQGVLEHQASEQLRGEEGDSPILQILPFGKGIPDLDGPVVVQADDVSGPGLLDMTALIRLKGDGIGYLNPLAGTGVMYLHSLPVAAGANPQEGNAVTMGRVHVGLDLEDEAGELLFGGRDLPLQGRSGPRWWCVLDEGIEQLLDPEVVDG